jgi:hypothetical protein
MFGELFGRTIEIPQIIPKIIVFFGQGQVNPGLKRGLMTFPEGSDGLFASKSVHEAMVPVGSGLPIAKSGQID